MSTIEAVSAVVRGVKGRSVTSDEIRALPVGSLLADEEGALWRLWEDEKWRWLSLQIPRFYRWVEPACPPFSRRSPRRFRLVEAESIRVLPEAVTGTRKRIVTFWKDGKERKLKGPSELEAAIAGWEQATASDVSLKIDVPLKNVAYLHKFLQDLEIEHFMAQAPNDWLKGTATALHELLEALEAALPDLPH